jgi:hypothetical protein
MFSGAVAKTIWVIENIYRQVAAVIQADRRPTANELRVRGDMHIFLDVTSTAAFVSKPVK